MTITNPTQSSDNNNNGSLPTLNEYQHYYEPYSYTIYANEDDAVDMDTVRMFEFVVEIGLNGVLSMFGIITNIINIIVFYRQGLLSESCTASLTGLAVSDFLSCLSSFLASVMKLLQHIVANDAVHSVYYATIWYCSKEPKDFFTQITCLVTAYLAFERFFSVMFPFKVKIIFTPLKSYVFICAIYVMTFTLFIPVLFSSFPGWVEISSHNITALLLIDNDIFFRGKMQDSLSFVNMVFFRIASIMIVIICNVILLWKVNMSKKFRKSATSKTQTDLNAAVSSLKENGNTPSSGKDIGKSEKKEKKDMKLTRMMVTICVMFVTCYSLNAYQQLYVVVDFGSGSLTFGPMILIEILNRFLETVNSSSNIFIYYAMSTRYRKELIMLYMCNKKQ